MRMRITLGTKLSLSFLSILILMGLMGIIITNQIGAVNQTVQQNYTHGLTGVKLTGDAITELLNARERLLLLVSATDADERAQQEALMNEHIDRMQSHIQAYKPLIETEGAQAALVDFDQSWNDFITAAQEVIQLAQAGKNEEANLALRATAEHRVQRAISYLQLVQDIEDNLSAARYAESQTLYQRSWNLAIGITLAAILIGLGLALWLTQTIASPLTTMAKVAQQVAAGDLGHTVPVSAEGTDEVTILGRAFNKMTDQMRDLVSGLEQRVAERTADLETTTADLSARSQELERALTDLQRRSEELEQANRQQARINQELEQATTQSRRRSALLQASVEVSRAIVQIRDLEKLLPRVTRLISQHFGFYHAGVFLVDESGRYAVLRAANSEGGQRMLNRGHRLEIGVTGIVGSVTYSGEPRIALDVGEDAVYFDNPDMPNTHSEMAVPLRTGDEIIGALDVQSTEPGAFDQEDVTVLSALADQIAIAIQNARLLQRAQQAVEAMEAAQRQYMSEQWQTVTQRRRAPRGEWQIAQSDVQLAASQQALERGEPVIVENNGSEEFNVSALAVPIKVYGQTIGVLDLQETAKEKSWSQDEIALVQTVADQVAQALETARLFDETRRRAQREQATRQITDRVRSRTEVDAMLQTVVQELAQTLGAPRVFVRLAPEVVAGDDVEQTPEEGDAA